MNLEPLADKWRAFGWQVIETDWTSAPILRHATQHIRRSGRSFAIYTTGGHIHLVVLRARGKLLVTEALTQVLQSFRHLGLLAFEPLQGVGERMQPARFDQRLPR